MTRVSDRGRLADWILVAITLGVQFWGLYSPRLPDLGAGAIPFADKAGHLLMFALATWALLRVVGIRVVLTLMAVQLVTSEVIQAVYLPGRTGDVLDALADAVGIAVGWWTWRSGSVSDEPGNTGTPAE